METNANRSEQRADAAAGVHAAAGRLIVAADGLLPARAVSDLRAALDRTQAGEFNLVVLGEFKRGKSSLINALLGCAALPVGAVPLTSVATVIRHARRETLCVHFEDGRTGGYAPESLAEFATEAGNPNNAKGVAVVEIGVPADSLRRGIRIVDTPGIGSIHAHNTASARRFLPQVDAGLFVLAADQPLSDAERGFLDHARASASRTLIAVNKVDLLDAAQRREVLDFIKRQLGDPALDLFAVSARTAEGITELAAHIEQLAGDEGRELPAATAMRLTRTLCSQAARAARFEAGALRSPLDDLALRAAQFEEHARELRAARDEAAALLRAALDRALREHVDTPLLNAARENERQLRARVQAAAAEIGPLAPRPLARALDAWVERFIEGEFERLVPRYERSIGSEIEAAQERFAERVLSIVRQVVAAASEVFGESVAAYAPDEGLRAPTRFSFKFSDPRHAADRLATGTRRAMPGGFGRRLAIGDAEQRLLHLYDRHAGRLRSELSLRTREAVQAYERELGLLVDEAIDNVGLIVGRARAEHDAGAASITRRVAQLEALASELEQIATEIAAVAAEGEG
jgi:small GTP-binding protein